MPKEFLIDCYCESPEHSTIWSYNWDTEQYTISIILNNRPWYERIIYAICYIFGYRSKYGYWDDFILTKKQLKNLLQRTTYE